MNRNPCRSLEDDVVALAMGELAPDRAAEVRRHLDTCLNCRRLYQEVAQEEAFIVGAFSKIAKTIKPARHHSEQVLLTISPKRLDDCGSHLPRTRRWRWTPIRALAAAAAVFLVATSLFDRLHVLNPSFGATLASVLQRVQKAKSVTYKSRYEVEGDAPVEMQNMAIQPGRLRSIGTDGTIFVRDYATGNEINIFPATKEARHTHMIQYDWQRLGHLLEWIATLHNSEGAFIGRQDMDGHKTNAFRVDLPYEQITIWADEQTDLPVRVERIQLPRADKDIVIPSISLDLADFRDNRMPSTSKPAEALPIRTHCPMAMTGPGVREKKRKIILTDFTWDVPLDESLFEVTPPSGYCASTIDLGECISGEDALIAALRLWAETSNGAFPSNINILNESRPKLIEKYKHGGPPEQEYCDALKMLYRVANGMFFAQTQKAAGNWHYAGEDVIFGQADRPLCWWRNKDSGTYHVVYGDLTTHDVSEPPLSKRP